jgi:nitroreductase
MIMSDIDRIIRERKTAKILRDPAQCTDLSAEMAATMRQTLEELIEVAGWAPFHKVADKQAHRQGEMVSPVPWRFYVLEKSACCQVVQFIKDRAERYPDSKWSNAWDSKIPKLLTGCSASIQVTWLPDPPVNGETLELTDRNIEHIAAASAAVQNLLLAAQARNLHNYWSSGGILNDEETFDYLGMPRNQMLLGAIFLIHPEQPYDENRPGGLREQRGAVSDWSTWVMLDSD